MAYLGNSASNYQMGIGSRVPDILVIGAEASAPAINTVLADTGPIGIVAVGLTSGQTLIPAVLIEASISNSDVAAIGATTADYEVAHRNAANSADVEVVYVPRFNAITVPAGSVTVSHVFKVKPGERILVRNKTAGVAATLYQVTLQGFQLPV